MCKNVESVLPGTEWIRWRGSIRFLRAVFEMECYIFSVELVVERDRILNQLEEIFETLVFVTAGDFAGDLPGEVVGDLDAVPVFQDLDHFGHSRLLESQDVFGPCEKRIVGGDLTDRSGLRSVVQPEVGIKHKIGFQ